MATQYKPSDVVTVGDISKTLNDWAAELGTPVQTILGRLKRGWPIDRACTEKAGRVPGNKGKKLDADVLNVDEVTALLQARPNSETAIRDDAIVMIAYRAGLRCCELIALELKDIDVSSGSITVRHGKGDKHRVVAMDPSGWPAVLKWLEMRATWSSTSAVSLLFCTRDGQQLDDRQVRAMIERRAKRAKITKRVHAHGLRRTMASEMMAEGIPLLDISGALGHANASTTNTYIKRVNPVSVLNAMKGRAWGGSTNATSVGTSTLPPPGWLDQLRTAIGSRLQLVHDARTNENEFKAIVILT